MRIALPYPTMRTIAIVGVITASGVLGSCGGLTDSKPECPGSFARAADFAAHGELLSAIGEYRNALSKYEDHPEGVPKHCTAVFAAGKAGFADVLRDLEEYDGAVAAYREAHRIAAQHDELEIERLVWQLAAIELELESSAEIDDPREELFAFTPLPGHDDPELEAGFFAAWGALMRRMDELDQAISMYRTAVDLSSQIDRPTETARLLRREAASRVMRRDDESAVELYLEALSFAERSPNRALEAEVHRELGRALGRLGELDRAESAWKSALTMYDTLELAPPDRIADIEFDLAVLYELDGSRGNAQDQYGRALAAYKEYFELPTDVRVPESARRHAEIVRRYDAARLRVGNTSSE